MRRGVLAVYLLALMTLSGCLGPKTAPWGSDGIDVDFSQEGTSINSDLGASSIEYENILPVGCEVGDTNYLSTGSSSPVSFTGFLAASNFYESHDPLNGAKDLELAVTTSVAIQSMSFVEASKIVEGDGARVDLEDWFRPLDPQTRAGTIDLDEIDGDSEDYWYILGLIPTTENIHDGMRSLDDWHQPVTIEGYLINPINNSSALGYYKPGNTSYSNSVDSSCNLEVGDNHRQSLYILVDKITLADAVVSDDGDSKDEWAYGDVPFFGRAGFILFFLIVGVGGGFGLFILSQLFVLQGAKSTMKTLLGREGMDKIKKVASDLRRSKAMGMVSPKERKKQFDREDKEERKEQVKSKPSKKEESQISGFDLDSVLSSSASKGTTTDFGGGSSSVVVTAESMEMEKENEPKDYQVPDYSYEKEEKPAWQPPKSEPRREQRSTNVVSSEPVSQKREHFSSAAPTSNSPLPAKKKKTVRKRKSVKSPVAEPKSEPEQEPKDSGFSDEEDFSNFSL